jgi:hypothetical protein
MPSEAAIEYFSKQAATWDRCYATSTFSVRIEVKNLNGDRDLSGQRWLDAGCGKEKCASSCAL